MSKLLWVSGQRGTFIVSVNHLNRVCQPIAPIARKFIGEPLSVLVRWFKVDRVVELKEERKSGEFLK